jgi:hypothetical protein
MNTNTPEYLYSWYDYNMYRRATGMIEDVPRRYLFSVLFFTPRSFYFLSRAAVVRTVPYKFTVYAQQMTSVP